MSVFTPTLRRIAFVLVGAPFVIFAVGELASEIIAVGFVQGELRNGSYLLERQRGELVRVSFWRYLVVTVLHRATVVCTFLAVPGAIYVGLSAVFAGNATYGESLRMPRVWARVAVLVPSMALLVLHFVSLATGRFDPTVEVLVGVPGLLIFLDAGIDVLWRTTSSSNTGEESFVERWQSVISFVTKLLRGEAGPSPKWCTLALGLELVYCSVLVLLVVLIPAFRATPAGQFQTIFPLVLSFLAGLGGCYFASFRMAIQNTSGAANGAYGR